jgi:hypothetical protein
MLLDVIRTPVKLRRSVTPVKARKLTDPDFPLTDLTGMGEAAAPDSAAESDSAAGDRGALSGGRRGAAGTLGR